MPQLDRTRLAPDDAYYVRSPSSDTFSGTIAGADGDGLRKAPSRRSRRNRSRSRRRKPISWKKLLWVKHPGYPDNYTDEETFLDHLQRNPRLQPYEFWPLVADSTVIVQQVCTMIVFVCCFSGIIQERVSPVTVVAWGTICTVLGWILWDAWVGQEEALKATVLVEEPPEDNSPYDSSRNPSFKDIGLGLSMPPQQPSMHNGNGAADSPRKSSSPHSRRTSASASASSAKLSTIAEPPHDPPSPESIPIPPSAIATTAPHPLAQPSTTQPQTQPSYSYYPPYGEPTSRFSPRNQQRLATAKSALLIYCALLGLSPILKSLTKSTASDSIWAISFWLMCINVFFFDYGGGVGATFPASLSTNAALMASTVLASRLPSTTHVFSLTLFSIEVFGLFPVFRRYLRCISWRGHLLVTGALVVGAGGGTAVCISGRGGWARAAVGVLVACVGTGLTMGICSWWLIGLQRFKNEIHGPWDPARPIIRRRWD